MPCPDRYKPTAVRLGSSIRNRGREYIREAAVHGLVYVADTRRPFAERLCWLLCIAASFLTVLAIVGSIMIKFQTDPMLTTTEADLVDRLDRFPTMYLCPPWSTLADNATVETYPHANVLYAMSWRGNNDDHEDKTAPVPQGLPSTPFSVFLLRARPRCESFVDEMRVGNLSIDVPSLEVRFTAEGFCCVVPNLPIDPDENASPVFIFRVFEYPVRLFLLPADHDQVLRHRAFHHFHFPNDLTVSFQTTRTTSDARTLTRTQRNCVFPDEQPSYGECATRCQRSTSIEICGCIPWFLVTPRGEDPECSGTAAYECLLENAGHIVRAVRDECQCRLSCDERIARKTRVRLAAEESRIIFDATRSIRYKRKIRFGWVDLLVSFGGIAGLFLGCSLLSLVEFGYYFTLRTYCATVIEAPVGLGLVVVVNGRDTTARTKVSSRSHRRRIDDGRSNATDPTVRLDFLP